MPVRIPVLHRGAGNVLLPLLLAAAGACGENPAAAVAVTGAYTLTVKDATAP